MHLALTSVEDSIRSDGILSQSSLSARRDFFQSLDGGHDDVDVDQRRVQREFRRRFRDELTGFREDFSVGGFHPLAGFERERFEVDRRCVAGPFRTTGARKHCVPRFELIGYHRRWQRFLLARRSSSQSTRLHHSSHEARLRRRKQSNQEKKGLDKWLEWFLKQEGWRDLRSAREEQLMTISCVCICHPNTRIDKTIEMLARRFYPESVVLEKK